MNDQFRLFPERASTISGDVDALYFFLIAVSVFFIALIAGSIFYFAIRYHRRPHVEYPQPIVGLVKLEIFWSVIPLMLTMVMFAWGASVFFRIRTPPEGAMEIYVLGKQWMWKVQHPSGRGEINELHVPLGRPVVLRMISEDVIHSFFVPAFRVKQDVLPGRYSELWFEANETGEFALFCTEYCGTKHSEMIGRVVVLQPADYQRWLAERLNEQPMALRGEWVFQKLRCASCHGAESDARRGPALAGRFGKPVPLADGRTVNFDTDYIRESILAPQRKVAAGYPPIMPTYEGQISEAEILAINDYLKAGGVASEAIPAAGQVNPPKPSDRDTGQDENPRKEKADTKKADSGASESGTDVPSEGAVSPGLASQQRK